MGNETTGAVGAWLDHRARTSPSAPAAEVCCTVEGVAVIFVDGSKND